MIGLVLLSLGVNVVITVTLSFLMLRSERSMDAIYGEDTAARRILACVYAAIAAVSLFALASFAFFRSEEQLVEIAVVLFPLQVLYKMGTLYAVGWANPVVRTNMAIVVLLCCTLAVIRMA